MFAKRAEGGRGWMAGVKDRQHMADSDLAMTREFLDSADGQAERGEARRIAHGQATVKPVERRKRGCTNLSGFGEAGLLCCGKRQGRCFRLKLRLRRGKKNASNLRSRPIDGQIRTLRPINAYSLEKCITAGVSTFAGGRIGVDDSGLEVHVPVFRGAAPEQTAQNALCSRSFCNAQKTAKFPLLGRLGHLRRLSR
jgi:hypothetical protein